MTDSLARRVAVRFAAQPTEVAGKLTDSQTQALATIARQGPLLPGPRQSGPFKSLVKLGLAVEKAKGFVLTKLGESVAAQLGI